MNLLRKLMNPLIKQLEHCLDHKVLVITGSFIFKDTPFNFCYWDEVSELFKLLRGKTSSCAPCGNRNKEEDNGIGPVTVSLSPMLGQIRGEAPSQAAWLGYSGVMPWTCLTFLGLSFFVYIKGITVPSGHRAVGKNKTVWTKHLLTHSKCSN